jgi:hypothetical protein
MPRARVKTPKTTKSWIMRMIKEGKTDRITTEDLNLAEEIDPNIRAKVMKSEHQIDQQPFPLPTPISPSEIHLRKEDLGSPPPVEEKQKFNKKQKEYHEFVEKRLGPFVVIVLFLFVFRGDEERAEFYAPNKEECKQLAPHVARIAPKVEEWLKIPQQVHDLIVTSDDSFSLLLVVVGYLKRTGLLGQMIPGFVGRIYKRTEERNMQNGVDIQQNGNGNHTGQPEQPTEWQIYGIGGQYQ